MSDLIPALSDSEIAAIDAEIAHVPYRSAVAIDALKIVQAHRGWVSDESLRAIARHLEMSAEELEGVATFYNLIFRRPVGDRVILLCKSITCWIKGCDRLQEVISGQLGVDLGETTADNAYTLLPVTCLGACDRAPVMMVGDDLHQDLDEASVRRILTQGTAQAERPAGDRGKEHGKGEGRAQATAREAGKESGQGKGEEG